MGNFTFVAEVTVQEFYDKYATQEFMPAPIENEYLVSSDNICVSNKKMFLSNVSRSVHFPLNFRKFKRINIRYLSNFNVVDCWIRIERSQCFKEAPDHYCFFDLDRETMLRTFYDDTHYYINIPYVIGNASNFIFLAYDLDSEDIEADEKILEQFVYDVFKEDLTASDLPFQHNRNRDVDLNWNNRVGEPDEEGNYPVGVVENDADLTGYNENFGHPLGAHLMRQVYKRDYYYYGYSTPVSVRKNYIRPSGTLNIRTWEAENLREGSFKFSCQISGEQILATYSIITRADNSETPVLDEFYELTIRSVMQAGQVNFLQRITINRVRRASSTQVVTHDSPIFRSRDHNLNVNISHKYEMNNNKILFRVFMQGLDQDGVDQYYSREIPVENIQDNMIDREMSPRVMFSIRNHFFGNLYYERNIYHDWDHEATSLDKQKISNYFNNIPQVNYVAVVGVEQSVFDENQMFLCFSSESGHHFPALNSIRQSGVIEKMHADQSLHDRMLNGLFLFYKNRIERLVIMDGTQKHEQVITEPLVFRNIHDSFSFGNNVYFIDDELRDLEGVIYSHNLKRERLRNTRKLGYSPSNHSLVLLSEDELVFLSLHSGQYHIHKLEDTTAREMIAVDNELLLIGDSVLSHNMTNAVVNDNKIATKVFTSNKKMKLVRVQVKGEELPGVQGEFSIFGKYFDKEVRVPEYSFKGLNKWHWLTGNSVYTEFQIEVRKFCSVEYLLVDVVERA
jgi:hypothetical protein